MKLIPSTHRLISYFILLISFTLTPAISTISQIIPAHRRIDWSTAGAGFDFSSPSPLVNVISFGAMGNGVTDDHAAITNAINSLNGSKGIVYFPAGNYLIGNTLVLPDSVTLKGSGAEFTVLKSNIGENKHIISITGTASPVFTEVTEGYSKNSFQLTLAGNGIFSKGDCAEIIQDGHLHMTSSWAMNSLGQMLVIDSVDGYNVFLKEPIRMDYDPQLNPRIRKISPRKVVSIECLKIERLTATTSQTSNIVFSYAYNCLISGVESNLCNFAHVDISKSTNITIRNSYFHHGHSYGSGGKAYGVCIQATSGSCLVENNIFRRLRHSMLLQAGSNGNVFACNYSFDPYWTGVSFPIPANSAGDIVLHGNYPYLNLFEGNIVQQIVIDDSHGKNGHHNTFFRNRAELYGIFMNNNPASDSVNFVGNEVTNNGFFMGLYQIYGVNHFQYGNNIKGTIQPVGTGNLSDVSYFYQQTPEFWNISGPFPPIGPPNIISSNTIPAKSRYLSGNNFAFCPLVEFTITASAGNHGSIDPSGEIMVEFGSSRLFTISADIGCNITSVMVDGVSVGAVQQYEFVDIAANHTIHANFSNLPDILHLADFVFPAYFDTCFAASQTISTAGDGSFFIMEEGTIVELVAGDNILLQYGTIAVQGSFFHARIAADSNWCNQPDGLLTAFFDESVVIPLNLIQEPNKFLFKIYPNPSSGNFTIEISGPHEDSKIIVEIFTLQGNCIISKEVQNQKLLYFCMADKPAGVYFVRVLINNGLEIIKLLII